ncbi:hypothetical protein [Jiella sonneratiae]|uniref:Tetratricopeptide repeat protein n=1 Tax=Jiella sonneratiae TaxID=2816856 RepID=A0ABS3IZ80_9HYPH|nr:hypothetical protein [Jiella sonneratiae]MBO0902712.1 hypothetical protein [Jiella sonneratiae]
MRLFTSCSLILALATVTPGPSMAQVTPPATGGPAEDAAPPRDPGTGGDNAPMIVPPPDESPETAPDAFGSPPVADDDSLDAPAGETTGPASAEKPDETREAKIDRLFAELKKQRDATEAARIAGRIEREWRRSGSATIDLLMQRAAKAMADKNDAAAMDELDQTLVLAPDYAEAWNRRATLNFTMDRWGKSLADIEQTLAREPRHWGALMGLAMILERLDEKQKAYDTYLKVLAVYPSLKSAQDAAARLADDLTGPAI